MQELDGKVVLVTGASRGLGYQAALEAARRGAHVIAIARTVGGLEDLDDDIKAIVAGKPLRPHARRRHSDEPAPVAPRPRSLTRKGAPSRKREPSRRRVRLAS